MNKPFKCECSDPGCPACHGHCQHNAKTCLLRVDMMDETGTLFCDACAADALESGLFCSSVRAFINATRRKLKSNPAPGHCVYCGGTLPGYPSKKIVCESCLTKLRRQKSRFIACPHCQKQFDPQTFSACPRCHQPIKTGIKTNPAGHCGGTITGNFNELGYEIWLNDRMIYQAGNHRQESSAVTDPGSPNALPLRILKKFCQQTMQELAQENHALVEPCQYTAMEPEQLEFYQKRSLKPNPVGQVQLSAPCQITPRLLPGVKIGDAWISIEYAKKPGREGRTRYLYHLDTPAFQFSSDDLQSGAQGGTLLEGMISLLSFLGAAAEAWQSKTQRRFTDNTDLFPRKVMAWADQHDNEIVSLQMELEEQQRANQTPLRENPVSVRRLPRSSRYRVRTPGGIKAYGTTRAKAQAQARLLRGVEHGMTLRRNPSADPSHDEMLEFLRSQFGSEMEPDPDFNAEAAIYWFAYFWHGGQCSELYSALSTSEYNPGPMISGPEPESLEMDMFRALEAHYFPQEQPTEFEKNPVSVRQNPPSGRFAEQTEHHGLAMQLIGEWIDLAAYYAGSDGNAWIFSRCTHSWANAGDLADFRKTFAQRRRGKLFE